MYLYNFESWFTLLTGFMILAMGLRGYWLDGNNRIYQAFLFVTFFLFVQNIFFFLMAQTIDLHDAEELRNWQEGIGLSAAFFVLVTFRLYAKQFIPRELTKAEKYWSYFMLLIHPIFIFLQIATPFGHGQLLLGENHKWFITIKDPQLYDWLRMLWMFLFSVISVYFTYLPFKYAIDRASKRLCGLVFGLYLVVMAISFSQNYILTIFFDTPSIINESAAVVVGAIFIGLMLVNLQLSDLNSENAFPNLMETMTNWFVLTDSNFYIHRVNKAFLNKMGENLIHWKNYPIHNLFEKEEWEECKKNIKNLKNKETLEWEFTVKKNNQVYYLMFAITPVFSWAKKIISEKDKVKAYAFVGTDLSLFKASENKTKAYAKELEASVNALESFAFIASHDLKEPIRNIKSFSGLLRRHLGGDLTETGSEYLGYIEENAKGMNELVHSIMAISRIGQEGLNFEKIAMDDLLSKKGYQMKSLFQKNNADLKIDALPIIHCDPQLVGQLFQNLLVNSIKYNTSNHPIINIYAPAVKPSDCILIKVEDNGIGIEKEYREQVFQMFKRLHSRQTYKGTGIGLAICKRIMELHKGDIWIEDARNGKGTTFVLSFPL